MNSSGSAGATPTCAINCPAWSTAERIETRVALDEERLLLGVASERVGAIELAQVGLEHPRHLEPEPRVVRLEHRPLHLPLEHAPDHRHEPADVELTPRGIERQRPRGGQTDAVALGEIDVEGVLDGARRAAAGETRSSTDTASTASTLAGPNGTPNSRSRCAMMPAAAADGLTNQRVAPIVGARRSSATGGRPRHRPNRTGRARTACVAGSRPEERRAAR